MDWLHNKQGDVIKRKLSLYKSYLGRLDQLSCYKTWLQEQQKNDNITNIKLYFNTYIFIHIKDFKEGIYTLHDKKGLKKYVNKKGTYDRTKAKKETLNIFLRGVG